MRQMLQPAASIPRRSSWVCESGAQPLQPTYQLHRTTTIVTIVVSACQMQLSSTAQLDMLGHDNICVGWPAQRRAAVIASHLAGPASDMQQSTLMVTEYLV